MNPIARRWGNPTSWEEVMMATSCPMYTSSAMSIAPVVSNRHPSLMKQSTPIAETRCGCSTSCDTQATGKDRSLTDSSRRQDGAGNGAHGAPTEWRQHRRTRATAHDNRAIPASDTSSRTVAIAAAILFTRAATSRCQARSGDRLIPSQPPLCCGRQAYWPPSLGRCRLMTRTRTLRNSVTRRGPPPLRPSPPPTAASACSPSGSAPSPRR